MNRPVFSKQIFLLSMALLTIAFVSSGSKAQAGNIGINGFFSVDSAQQGSTFKAAIIMEIPGGLHVNANKPLSKYAIPTTIKVEVPGSIRFSPVTYPRSIIRTLRRGAGEERVAVYEDRAIFRFNITIPFNLEPGAVSIRVNVHYQYSNDAVSFPPATRELTIPISITDKSKPMKKINRQYFG